jgi:hypothetical protein
MARSSGPVFLVEVCERRLKWQIVVRHKLAAKLARNHVSAGLAVNGMLDRCSKYQRLRANSDGEHV